MTELQEKIAELYQQGLTAKQVGEIVGKTERTICYHLQRLGITRSQKKIDDEIFVKLWNEGKTDKEIAKYFGIAVSTIKSYRTRGERAGKFNITRYFSQEEHKLSELQKQFIFGSLLGDMSIGMNKRSKNARISLIHCQKQEELFMKKVELLGEFMGNYKLYEGILDKRTEKRYPTFKGNSKAHEEFTKIYHLFYSERKKVITQEILDKITHPIALAYWFMDDGNSDGTIATNGFTEQEVNLLVNWLKSFWKFDCSKQKQLNNFVIHIKSGSRKQFDKLIKPYMVKSMYYKLKYT